MGGLAAMLSRLGPWLGRAGTAAAENALVAVSKATGTKFSKIDDLVAYVKGNKANAVLALSTLASTGFAVSDLFTPADKQDPETRQLATELAVIEMSAIDGRLNDVAASSEQLKGLSGNRSDLLLLREVLTWAAGEYGSVESAKRAFKMHQAFFELSAADVENGYDVLGIR